MASDTENESALTWDYGIVAFLDVLGFSHLVETDAACPEPLHLRRIVRCLRSVSSTSTGLLGDIQTFSDSIILAAPLGVRELVEVVSVVRALQRVFINNNLLLRGAIAFGKHFGGTGITYSQALVAAYHLERDQARFPRVLLQHDLLSWFAEQSKGECAQLECMLLLDRDERVFVHYLDLELLPAHATLLSTYERGQLSASVLEKAQWLAAYHNHVAPADGSHSLSDSRLVAGFRKVERETYFRLA
ncbi:MAG: hypothetical protein QM784_36970 [Polyangiaceae bacterium]